MFERVPVDYHPPLGAGISHVATNDLTEASCRAEDDEKCQPRDTHYTEKYPAGLQWLPQHTHLAHSVGLSVCSRVPPLKFQFQSSV